MIQEAFSRQNLDWKQQLLETQTAHLLKFLQLKKVSNIADLYALIGEGQVSVNEVIRQLYPHHTFAMNEKQDSKILSEDPDESNVSLSFRAARKLFPWKFSTQEYTIPGFEWNDCCQPVQGDQIVGIVGTGKGVTIRTYDCDNLGDFCIISETERTERLINVDWDMSKIGQQSNVKRLQVVMVDQQGALASLTTTIHTHQGNIIDVEIIDRSDEFVEVLVDVDVGSTQNLASLIAALRMANFVRTVETLAGSDGPFVRVPNLSL